ncbi:hypothetical protein DL93DRAFT_1744329 [Clavulina sp. PMI_390]|nr:hypothetical protein DL93DRAFT_1744329 [Clavulina sp. PMI_390]
MNNPSTIAVGPLDEQCTGDQWIARLNTDVVEQILALLDPWSLLQFTLVCKPFYEIFFNDRVLWAHTLQTLAAQECLAPHSFDHPKFHTPAALRRIATRFYRFTDAIVEPNRLLRAHVDEYQLGQLTVGVNKVAVDHDDGVLLPGGRWLLSVVTESEEGPDGWPRYLSCWDLLGAVDGTLVSAASIPLEGGIWGEAGTAGMRTHMCEGGKAVAIAFLFVGSVEDNGCANPCHIFPIACSHCSVIGVGMIPW